MENANKVSIETLKTHLWKSADILRGHIDAADYKNYIFGLLFLKRLSDVYEEECEKIVKKTGDKKAAEDADYHDFFVPAKARWSRLRSLTHNIGEAINKANDAIEEANPVTLEGVLTPVDFNDKDRLPDHILSQLVNHFSELCLRNDDLEKPDILGDAYEYLIGQFASSAGKKGGEFYTPKEVVMLLVDLLDPEEGMRIYDPACGSGGMLVQTVQHLKEHHGNPRNISLFGQEINVGTWAICKMNLLLHGLKNAQIKRGDTLRDPKFLEAGGKLKQFDIVIANPPFSLKNWGYEKAQNDPHRRFRFGVPPKGYADYAFVQHMIASAGPSGKVGVVLPHGALFRGGAEGKIRKGIIEEDLIEAVIGLPPKLFYGAGIPACLLILNKKKPKQRQGNILFIYGANDYQEGKKQNKLRPDDHIKIWNAFENYQEIRKYCRPVPLSEIRENDYNLNITRYIDATEEEAPVDIQKTIDELKALKQEYGKVESKVFDYLKELNYKV